MKKIVDIASREEEALADKYGSLTTSDQMAIDLVFDLFEDVNYNVAAKVVEPYYNGGYDTYKYASKIADALRWDIYGAAIVGCLILENWGHPLADRLNDVIIQDDPSIFDGY